MVIETVRLCSGTKFGIQEFLSFQCGVQLISKSLACLDVNDGELDGGDGGDGEAAV